MVILQIDREKENLDICNNEHQNIIDYHGGVTAKITFDQISVLSEVFKLWQKNEANSTSIILKLFEFQVPANSNGNNMNMETGTSSFNIADPNSNRMMEDMGKLS